MQSLQDAVTVRSLRLIEDVKTAEPRREGEAGQKQDRNGPGKVVDAPPRPRVRLLVLISPVSHLPDEKQLVQFGCVASKDDPQPQVRAASGFAIWNPTLDRPSR